MQHLRVVCFWPSGSMQCVFLRPHRCHRGFIRELEQTTRLHEVREKHEHGLLGSEDFAHQHEAE